MTHDPCPDYLPLIVRAAEDSLGLDDLRVLESHLATCPRCAEALQSQRIARTSLQALPRTEAPPFFAARVRAQLAGAPAAKPALAILLDFRRWTWRLGTVAAALALATGLVAAGGDASGAGAGENVGVVEELPASAALWSGDVSETSLLSIMLHAGPDEPLSDALQEAAQ